MVIRKIAAYLLFPVLALISSSARPQAVPVLTPLIFPRYQLFNPVFQAGTAGQRVQSRPDWREEGGTVGAVLLSPNAVVVQMPHKLLARTLQFSSMALSHKVPE